MSAIYFGTVLLEKNRWSTRVPSILPSQWAARIAAAGFDGVEMWEHHVTEQPGELEAFKASGVSVPVFNCYANFTDHPQERYQQIADAIIALGSKAVKYNFPLQGDLEDCRSKLLAFAKLLPDDCKLLCECHEGSILEDYAVARDFFADMPARFCQIIHLMSPIETVKRDVALCGDRLGHVHVQIKTADKQKGNLAEHLQVLKDAGYNGTYTIEFTQASYEPNEETENAFVQACDDMKALRALL